MHRREHTAEPDRVRVEDDGDGDGLYRLRLPIASTAEARDGRALDADIIRGWREQIAAEPLPAFLDHGQSGLSDGRYGALGKVGYWTDPELVERDGATDLEADAVIADPDALDDDNEIRDALSWLRTQAELGFPIATSAGWSEEVGDRDPPGGTDLMEASIVGIPSDERTTATATADAGPAALARAASAASEGFDWATFRRELKQREVPNVVEEVLGDRLVPNQGVGEACRQALAWIDEHGRDEASGGTETGVRRANQLERNQREQSRLTGTDDEGTPYWLVIDAWHSRHRAQGNHLLADDARGEPWTDPGYLASHLWGHDAAASQAETVAEAIREVLSDRGFQPATRDDIAERYGWSRDIDDPEFSEGNAVRWSWQGTPVHGRVAGVHEQYTPPEGDDPITGDDGEAVYSIHEWDQDAEVFEHVEGRPNVARTESSLQESQLEMPPVNEDTLRMSDSAHAGEEAGTDEENREDTDKYDRLQERVDEVYEMCEELREMNEEETRLLREMHEGEYGDGDHDDDDEGGEENAAPEATDGDGTEERSVRINGEEVDADEALDRLRAVVESGPEADDPDTRSVGEDPGEDDETAPDEERDADGNGTDSETNDEPTFGFTEA